MSNGVQLPGKEMLNKKVLSWQQKVSNDEAVHRETGRVFHACAAATGNARSPRLDRLVAGTDKVDVEPVWGTILGRCQKFTSKPSNIAKHSPLKSLNCGWKKCAKSLIRYYWTFRTLLRVHLKKWTLKFKLLYLLNHMSYFNKICRIYGLSPPL